MPIRVTIRNVRSLKVLDVPDASTEPLLQIQQYTDGGGGNQQWTLWPLANTLNQFYIQSGVASPPTEPPLVLDALGSGTAWHTQVIQYPLARPTGTPNQHWTFERVGHDNTYGEKFVIWPGHANDQLDLDVTGGVNEDHAKIQLFPRSGFTGGENEQWYVEAALIEV
jgi:hypothetical protein